MIYVYVSLSFTFPFNFTDLINRQKINANMLKKEGGNKTFKCHKGGRAIYWRYFISNHLRKKNALPVTEKKSSKNKFFATRYRTHIYVHHASFLRTNALRDLTRRNARAVFIWHCISLTVLNTPSFI